MNKGEGEDTVRGVRQFTIKELEDLLKRKPEFRETMLPFLKEMKHEARIEKMIDMGLADEAPPRPTTATPEQIKKWGDSFKRMTRKRNAN
jgi:hypothetical protein